jgi:hypothetical protein
MAAQTEQTLWISSLPEAQDQAAAEAKAMLVDFSAAPQ